MEEQEFKQTYHLLNPTPCVFEKTILSGRGLCAACRRLYLAEREGVLCATSNPILCAQFRAAIAQNAQFTLKLTHLSHPLPHPKEMKLQVGALLGLQTLLHPETAGTSYIHDIKTLLTFSLSTFGSLEQLPYQELIKFIHHFQIRPRH